MSQASSRVGWNGGLGWWEVGESRGCMAFALGFYSIIKGIKLT